MMRVKTLPTEPEERLNALWQVLQSLDICLEQPEEVLSYLHHHPELSEVVAYASRKTRLAFPHATLLLQLYYDPEIEDCFLTLLIRLPHYESSVYEQIEEMEEQLAPLLDSTSDKFLLNTDFQPIIEACQQQTVE